MTSGPTVPFDEGTDLRNAILWVKDAPLVIDDENIARFYDAIVRPAYRENAPRRIRLSEAQRNELQTNLIGRAKASVGALFGVLTAEAEASGSRQRTKGSEAGVEEELVLEPISTSQRQLEQLVIFYSLVHRERLLIGELRNALDWQQQRLAKSLPRALCLVDLPSGAKVIPMAAEFENGKVERLFERLAAKVGRTLPAYDRNNKAAYWLELHRMADPAIAAQIIEESSDEHGKIEWIDFRVVLEQTGQSVHLHLESRGRFFTGAFAYMVVRRVVGHGLRLVGTLKDGPDINVLAIYEK